MNKILARIGTTGNPPRKEEAMRIEYYYKHVVPFVDDLILDYGKHTREGYRLDLDNLDDDIPYQLAALLIEQDDRDLFCLYENEEYDDIVSALINLLKDGSEEEKKEFSNTIRDKIVSYYKVQMQVLIDDRCSWLDSIYREENNISLNYYSDNGEPYEVRHYG